MGQAARAAVDIATAVWNARDLMNTLLNEPSPAAFADRVNDMSAALDRGAEVLDEVELEAQSYGGVAAVGRHR
ncbi:hypothetical protein [Saccharothrix algeriensis]|uniref:Leucyl aminopeptidase n=2 Tax=Saccharothrix algeriensis TaxID=173560 RepID=A0ABS2S2J6_9PSEU|nr:hypothetical protein [Saccharothrix algeriensis]MBM7810468.1 leucyl aminopeptidase [Saccharothrix algeriensis]